MSEKPVQTELLELMEQYKKITKQTSYSIINPDSRSANLFCYIPEQLVELGFKSFDNIDLKLERCAEIAFDSVSTYLNELLRVVYQCEQDQWINLAIKCRNKMHHAVCDKYYNTIQEIVNPIKKDNLCTIIQDELVNFTEKQKQQVYDYVQLIVMENE